MIIDNPKQLGFMDSGTGKHQSNTVYDEKGICRSTGQCIEGGAEGIWIYAGKNGGGAWDFQKDPCGD